LLYLCCIAILLTSGLPVVYMPCIRIYNHIINSIYNILYIEGYVTVIYSIITWGCYSSLSKYII